MSARELKVHRLETDEAIVSLVGEHDGYTAPQIAATVRSLLEEGFDVRIDLGEATFIDSTTVGALIDAHRLARESGRSFTIVVGDTSGWAVRRLFELTQLDSLLRVAGER